MGLMVDQPAWLLLGVVGIGLALLGWRWMKLIPPMRRLIAISLRVCLFFALGLALAGVYRVERVDRIAVIAVVDVSGSVQSFASLGEDDLGLPITIDRAARGFLGAASLNRLPEDLLGVVAFDGRVSTIAMPTQSSVLDRPIEFVGIDGSDLVGAIQRAQMQLPADASGRVVVFSDGRSTAQGLEELASECPIDVVPIRYRVDQEVVVESVDLPARSLPESIVDVRVVIKSVRRARGELVLRYQDSIVDLNGDEPSVGRSIVLDAGHQVIVLPIKLSAGRVHRFDAKFVPERDDDLNLIGDTSLANNTASGLTLTSGDGRILVLVNDLESNPHEAQLLESLLDASPWVAALRSPSELPLDLLELEAFDLIVLVNTPRDALDLNADVTLKAFVEDLGGGLLWIGGREALGAGGWIGTAIEDIMPVHLDVPDDLVMPKVAAVFVLDSSGSMKRKVLGSASSQQSIANEAASGAVDVLDEHDFIGVVSFSDRARTVVAMTKNDQPESTQAQIKSIHANGGTNLSPAMRMAGEMLAGVESETKHIIILSDGESQNPEALPKIARELSEMGITISTIAVGDEADEKAMKEIALLANGAYYRVRNPSVLPRVFLKVVRVIHTPMVREGEIGTVVLSSDSPATGHLGSLPILTGLVITDQIDDDPRVSTPIISDRGEPIFAFHQVELGRVSVFAADLSSWSSRWIDSGDLSKILINAIGWTKRSNQHRAGELSFLVNGSNAQLEFNAIDEQASPIDGLTVHAQIFDEQGGQRSVDLIQTGTGKYEARIDHLGEGVHVVIAQPMRDDEPMYPTIAGLEIAGIDEFAYFDDYAQALVDLANRTGGRVFNLADPSSADLFDRSAMSEQFSFEPIWPMLLWAAFGLFLLDLAARRVAFDRWITQARDETVAATRAVQSEQVEHLKAAKATIEDGKPDEPEMDRSPMQAIEPKIEAKQAEQVPSEDSNPLLAAKRRARERMDED